MHVNDKKTKRETRRRGGVYPWACLAASGFAFLLVVAGTSFVHARISVDPNLPRGGNLVPKPQVARILALGFDSVVSDYYWLKAVQMAGGARTPGPEQGAYIGRLMDLVTYLNPHVGHAYRFAAVWLTQSEQQVREANRLLRRGIEYHPDDWRNWFYLGFNQFYYLDETEKASRTLSTASQLPGAPAYLSRLVARLRAESGRLDVAHALLLEMLNEAEDEEIQVGYLSALSEIEIERRARVLDAARESFREIHGRDIRSVDELVAQPEPILPGLPEADPSGVLPRSGTVSSWLIDAETDRIVSSYYGRRYRVNFSPDRALRVQEWKDSPGSVMQTPSGEGE